MEKQQNFAKKLGSTWYRYMRHMDGCFHSFLSPVWNQRTDEFGGSLENRARFFTMVVDKVREAVGKDFPIEARISGDDLTDKGLGLEDCIKVAK